jgi:hypothetical protein
MDARRAVEVAANRLEAVLNVVAQGGLGTPAGHNRPLDFSGTSSNFQIGLQMQAPLDQVQVRNIYRQSLVNLQQARRAYMLLEDQVKYDIRTNWRQLKMNAQNFETNRKALRQAALQLDINVANNLNPKNQVAGQGGTTNLGTTGLNLNQALNALLQAQNNLIQYWCFYERNRINIHRDMDTMVIDERGVWDDPLYQNLVRDGLPSLPNESANDIPPEPLAKSGSIPPQRAKPSPHPGIVRIGQFSPADSAPTAPNDVDRRDRNRSSGRVRLAPTEIRLVSDHDGPDAESGPDGRVGDGVGEDGDVPDNGRREGNSRQYEKRGPVE